MENLGISESEERLYSWLLTHRGARSSEIAKALRITPRKTRRLLDDIEAKGLATHSPGRQRRYIPALPDVALGALVMQRQRDLQSTQLAIDALQEKATSEQQEEHEQLVELVTDSEAERQVFDQLSIASQREILGLVRPPLRSSRLGMTPDEDHPVQSSAKRRGVRYRGIVDANFMTLPGAVSRIRQDIHSGEDIRILPELPFKMLISDRKTALIPLSLQRSEGPSLLVKSSALMDALCVLFELLWERASPLYLSGSKGLNAKQTDSRLDEKSRELISIMATGLNDKSILLQLGISRRTHQRRVTELMKTLNARTRFQAGWLAARHLPAENAGDIG